MICLVQIATQWQESHRFFSYVASYWGEHVKGDLEKALESLILQFFGRKVHLLYGLQEYNRVMFRNLEYDTWPHEPSPLHLAAYWGLSHISQVLIERGADIHATDAWGRTPLFCASLNGHWKTILVLADKGANVNLRDMSAATALHAAVMNNHVAVALLLLKSGVDPNAQDKNGSSPMCNAASNGSVAMMEVLLVKGASIEKVGTLGSSPFEIASRGGRTSAVQWLLRKGVDVCSQNASSLIEATYANQPHLVPILLDAGAAINEINELGYTAIGAAVKKGHTSMVEQLLAAGANVNVTGPNPSDTSPLQMAAIGGNETLVALLLRHGANANAEGGDLGTVLQLAVYSQNLTIVSMILEQSPNANIGTGNYGPLHFNLLCCRRTLKF